MVLDMTSASLALAALLVLWLIPLPAYILSTRMRGLEKFNWAMLLAFLSWPAFAVYLVYAGVKKRNSQ